MLTLETHLRLDESISSSPNLCARFPDEDLAKIGAWVWDGYERDEGSRKSWMMRTQAAMDLALQVQKEKSFPWPNSSNIAFPLVTIAAMQFHARAYPALVNGTEIVKCRVPGPDPTGELTAKASRIGKFMSYQVLEEDQAWEEQQDRLLLQIPIVGCAFKKSSFISHKGHPVGELVPAVSLVVDYYAKSVETAARKTHILALSRNEVHERCRSGIWKDITEEPWYTSLSGGFIPPGGYEADRRKGTNPPRADEATPLTFLEQHCALDFDQDGYAEPYIVTIDASSKAVVRIVARWESPLDVDRDGRGRVVRITSTEYFTKYGLIPSADGSIYDLGFGILLGPLNESVNSLCNMILDSGTLSTSAGGFLSRGVKVRGGVYSFSPFEWNRVDSTGDDLSKGIVPLPVREPSAVLFQMLSFLVNYTQRVSGSTDAIAGENPGQNTPAATQQSMIEQGQKIYAALFKRVWRCMKGEFSKLFVLNARYLPESRSFGQGGQILREDFLGDASQVVPVADPNVTSDQMRMQQAASIVERAGMVGGYNKDAVERNLLAAMHVEGVDNLYLGLDKMPPPPPDVKLQIAQMKEQAALQIAQGELELAKMRMLIEAQEAMRLNAAMIIKLEAEATLAAAKADAEPMGHQIALFDAMIGLAKTRDESLRAHVELLLKGIELKQEAKANGLPSGGGLEELAPPPNNPALSPMGGGAEGPAQGAMGLG